LEIVPASLETRHFSFRGRLPPKNIELFFEEKPLHV
jgi:hypothetical protein